MSQFIKSSAELAEFRKLDKLERNRDKLETNRISGFTEAERAAADWARNLIEARENLARPTNLDVRGTERSRPGSEALRTAKHVKELKEGKENKKEKKDKKLEKSDKDRRKIEKDDRKTEKGVRKMAKQMRKEEKERNRNDPEADTENTPGHCHLDSFPRPVSTFLDRDGFPLSSSTSRLDPGSAIDHLIEGARLEASATEEGAGQQPQQSPINIDGETAQCSGAAPRIRTLQEYIDEEGDKIGEATTSRSQEAEARMRAALGMPPDPRNPLDKAHDEDAYRVHLEGKGKTAIDEEFWDHLPFLRRSPSPCRVRTSGNMYPTRLGAWKSRAGGAYLPPTDDTPAAEELEELARYVYPDDFKERGPKTRRSPSYGPERKCKSGSSSSSKSRSRSLSHSRSGEKKRKKKRKRAKSSSSPEYKAMKRASPEYKPEMGAHVKQVCTGPPTATEIGAYVKQADLSAAVQEVLS